MGSFLRAIVLILITFYMALIYQSVSLALLGFCEVLFVLFAFLYLMFVSYRLKVSVDIPIVIAEKGGMLSLYLRIKNGFFLPLGRVKVQIAYGLSTEDRPLRKWLWTRPVMPGSNRYSYQVLLPEAGCYEFSVRKQRIYDMSGLFYFSGKRKGKGYATAIVLPRLWDVAVHLGENVRNFFGDADVYDELRPGYDPAEMFEVREFADGDKLQSIHWKLSAKMDELVVRENSMPKTCPVVMFLNIETKSPNQEKKGFNYYELCASLSFSLMDAGCPHYVVWHSKSRGELLRTRVDDEESFYLCLTTWMQDAGLLTGDYRENYRLKYRSEPYLHRLELYRRGQVVLDGRVFENASPRELEIIL